ncbi:hypothetical protein KKI24_24340 [bacterium]|nr:hypothetical protein [bacterium]
MTSNDVENYQIEYRLNGENRRLRGRGTSEEDVRGKAMLHLLDKYSGSLEIIAVKPAEQKRQSLPEEVVQWVITGRSFRVDCETEGQSLNLAAEIKAGFKSLGQELNFDAWVFGRAVHAFPVYYRCRGSLADLDDKAGKDRGRYGHR